MTLTTIAQRILPVPLYQRLAASSMAKRLARGSLWSLVGSATSRLLVLLAMILVARVLGQEAFGELGLIQSTLGVFGLMAGIGLGGTGTRFVAQYAKTDPDRAGRIIALVLSASMVTILVAALALIATSGPIARSVLGAEHLQTALISGAVLMAATALRGIQGGVLAGLEKFDLIAKLNMLDGALSLAAMVLLAKVMGVQGALLGLALSATLVWVAGRVLLMRELEHRSIQLRYRGCLADWPILTGYTLPSFLANVVATPVLWFAMTLVANSEHGFAALGLYNAAYQWHGPMIFLPLILTSVSIPVLVQEWESGRRDRFRSVTLWICGLTLAVALPPAALVALLSPWIMGLYGPGFLEGWLLLVLLVAAAPLHAIAKIASGALLGMNRAWRVLAINLAWGITLLALTVWLLPTHGVVGLAIAFVAAYAVLGSSALTAVILGSQTRPNSVPHASIGPPQEII